MKTNFYSYSSFIQRLNESSQKETPSPEFTPHEEFHKFRWLKSSGGKWYYRLKDFKPCVLPKNQNFHQSLDPELQKVVSYLHGKKIPTTPSCSGHFHSPDQWAEKWEDLMSECKEIRGHGLKLTDPEDNFSTTLKDPAYNLPWSKKSFVERAAEHQKFGVLGLYDPGNFFAKKISHAKIPNSQMKKDGALTLFLTSPRNAQELKECWSKFTEALTKNPLS